MLKFIKSETVKAVTKGSLSAAATLTRLTALPRPLCAVLLRQCR